MRPILRTLPLLLASALMLLVACERPTVQPTPIEGQDIDPTLRAVVLNEGSWGQNNAELSLIDGANGRLTPNWFSQSNQRGLGDVAQDMVCYGSKIYVTVTFSNSLEVVDPRNGHSERIDLGDRQPRYMAAANGMLYITCYRPHSVVSIDTATLQITHTTLLGRYNPEGIAFAGGRLWVASSFVQLENGDFARDTLLYTLDPTTMSLVDSISVGLNPQRVVAIDEQHVAVNYSGDYSPNSDGTILVTLAPEPTTQELGVCLTEMCAANGLLYGYSRSGYGANSTADYFTFDPATMSFESLSLPLGTPYGISVDPDRGDIYLFSDGNYIANGDIFCFRSDGTLRWQAEAARLPKKALFLSAQH